jgi:uncharacterized membrane protein
MPNIHPFVIHFPIALLSVALIAECSAILVKREELSRAGWWMQLAGTVGLLVAAGTGLLAGDSVRLTAGGDAVFDIHRELAFISSAVFALLLFWRIATRTQRPPGRDLVFLLLFAAGVAALLAGAWYGGEMVYRYGAGVQAPHSAGVTP